MGKSTKVSTLPPEPSYLKRLNDRISTCTQQSVAVVVVVVPWARPAGEGKNTIDVWLVGTETHGSRQAGRWVSIGRQAKKGTSGRRSSQKSIVLRACLCSCR